MTGPGAGTTTGAATPWLPDPAPTRDAWTSGAGPLVEVVSPEALTRVGARAPLAGYVAQLWGRRSFLWEEARGRVIGRTRETVLGQAWLVVRPVLDGLAYYVVFGLLLGSRRGIDNYVGYLVVGTFLFAFTSQCLTSSTRSIRTGRALVRAFTFPRASLPVSAVLQGVVSLGPALLAMLLLVVVLPERERWGWSALLFPLVVALQAVFVLGASLVVARVGAVLPDVNQLISVLLRFWFYGSGVFFSFDGAVSHPVLLALVHANPMFLVIDAARDCLLYARTPAFSTWAALTAWALGSLVAGITFFWHGEESYGRA
ncbi:ABC transporter permease [Cellulomonas hominis]|uniref:ABC transporter permease n=1 Tax=Cellulomonas hominis TaxID=156981 RepID=UPI001B9D06B7|nr:ABC transporter permease [Cellulomonas hominis]VTR77845.1 Teichoic acid translocation permease protein TagG [Cellulomonas hominis]